MTAEKDRYWKEAGLKDAVLRGDKEAWRVLYDASFDGLYAFVDFRTGHRRDRTEEAVQETWMVAVRRIEVFDPSRSAFETWMRGIAVNVIRNLGRRWHRSEGFEGIGRHSDKGAPDAERVERIGRALTELPEHYRAVIRAKYEEKRSVIEIARSRKESPKAVESLLTRARSAFRKAFTRLEKER